MRIFWVGIVMTAMFVSNSYAGVESKTWPAVENGNGYNGTAVDTEVTIAPFVRMFGPRGEAEWVEWAYASGRKDNNA